MLKIGSLPPQCSKRVSPLHYHPQFNAPCTAQCMTHTCHARACAQVPTPEGPLPTAAAAPLRLQLQMRTARPQQPQVPPTHQHTHPAAPSHADCPLLATPPPAAGCCVTAAAALPLSHPAPVLCDRCGGATPVPHATRRCHRCGGATSLKMVTSMTPLTRVISSRVAGLGSLSMPMAMMASPSLAVRDTVMKLWGRWKEGVGGGGGRGGGGRGGGVGRSLRACLLGRRSGAERYTGQ